MKSSILWKSGENIDKQDFDASMTELATKAQRLQAEMGVRTYGKYKLPWGDERRNNPPHDKKAKRVDEANKNGSKNNESRNITNENKYLYASVAATKQGVKGH